MGQVYRQALGAALFALGCGQAGAPYQQQGELRGSCPQEVRLGGFVVQTLESYSIVDGKIADGVVPVTIQQLVTEQGDCRLLKRQNPFCDPPCAGLQTCDFDGQCIAYPSQLDVGTVTIAGLRKEVVLAPKQPGNSYFDTELPHPVFAAGDPIALSTTQGRFGQLALRALGVEMLALEGEDWTVSEGQPLVFRWTPPAAGARSWVAVELTVDQHGVTPISLHCRFADTGQGEVPVALVDQILTAGVSGFPNGTLTRLTADQVPVELGCVDLEVSSPRAGRVRVSGHTPCKQQGDCPAGKTCDLPTETCR